MRNETIPTVIVLTILGVLLCTCVVGVIWSMPSYDNKTNVNCYDGNGDVIVGQVCEQIEYGTSDTQKILLSCFVGLAFIFAEVYIINWSIDYGKDF